MKFESPFAEGSPSELSAEQKTNNSELRRKAGREMRKAGFSETMKSDQYSSYHTEGEYVADHYRTIFNVMQAIQNPEDEKSIQRLPEATREELAELDPSVAKTIREFPSLMRYVVLAHDLAKKNQDRSVNPRIFTLPENEDPESIASLYSKERSKLESEISQSNVKREEIRAKEKTVKKMPEKAAALKLDRDALSAEIENLEKQIAAATVKLYDDLRASGMSGQFIHERYGLGVGFTGHEKASAELVRNMDLPENLRGIMAKMAEDHMLPLMRFGEKTIEDKRGKNKDGTFKKSEEQVCAESYRDTYKDYSEIEFRLSAAMAALDILGSVPKGGKPDLAPIRRLVTGKRENELQNLVKEHLNEEIGYELSQSASPYANLVGIDLANPNTPMELKEKYREMKQAMEKRLRERYQGLV